MKPSEIKEFSPGTWYPIESAPKDGPADLWCTNGHVQCRSPGSSQEDGEWYDANDDQLSYWGWEPTHWSPIPEPPK